MIVTTIQKMQILISKRLKEGTPEYNRLRGLKIAFVVDECHRAVSPATKRIIERFLESHSGLALPEHHVFRRILIR